MAFNETGDTKDSLVAIKLNYLYLTDKLHKTRPFKKSLARMINDNKDKKNMGRGMDVSLLWVGKCLNKLIL